MEHEASGTGPGTPASFSCLLSLSASSVQTPLSGRLPHPPCSRGWSEMVPKNIQKQIWQKRESSCSHLLAKSLETPGMESLEFLPSEWFHYCHNVCRAPSWEAPSFLIHSKARDLCGAPHLESGQPGRWAQAL